VEFPEHRWNDAADHDPQPRREEEGASYQRYDNLRRSLAYSFSAGDLLETFGWQALNCFLLPWLGIAALALKQLSPIGQEGTDLAST
jgi:hypothetical protein